MLAVEPVSINLYDEIKIMKNDKQLSNITISGTYSG